MPLCSRLCILKIENEDWSLYRFSIQCISASKNHLLWLLGVSSHHFNFSHPHYYPAPKCSVLPSYPVLTLTSNISSSNFLSRKITDTLNQFSKPGFMCTGLYKKTFWDLGMNHSKGIISWSSTPLTVLKIGLLKKECLLLYHFLYSNFFFSVYKEA